VRTEFKALVDEYALPSGQLSMRPVEASQFAVRDFGEQNWVMLSSVNLSQDYQRQSLAHIVDAVERPRKRLASLVECGGITARVSGG
jgi:hypothetical protein